MPCMGQPLLKHYWYVPHFLSIWLKVCSKLWEIFFLSLYLSPLILKATSKRIMHTFYLQSVMFLFFHVSTHKDRVDLTRCVAAGRNCGGNSSKIGIQQHWVALINKLCTPGFLNLLQCWVLSNSLLTLNVYTSTSLFYRFFSASNSAILLWNSVSFCCWIRACSYAGERTQKLEVYFNSTIQSPWSHHRQWLLVEGNTRLVCNKFVISKTKVCYLLEL